MVEFDVPTPKHARTPDSDDEVIEPGNMFVEGETGTNNTFSSQSTNIEGDSDNEDATDEDEDTEDG